MEPKFLLMEEIYGFNPTAAAADYSDKALLSPENLILPSDYHSLMINYCTFRDSPGLISPENLISASISTAASEAPDMLLRDGDDTSSTAIKAKIASHPRYPHLLQAYIDCHKVGASPEVANILSDVYRQGGLEGDICLGAEPELDEFMESYCEILDKYKSDLSTAFYEATTFFNNVEMQLCDLCNNAFDEEGGGSSDEECSGGEMDVQDLKKRDADDDDEERDIKDKLARRFGSHIIRNLKLEFSRKKKKGKLPREARLTLLHWWNSHYKWPYPTEADKTSLAETTGLDQRQINNWFINQRKRHWKPSENMQFALMDNLSGQYFTDD